MKNLKKLLGLTVASVFAFVAVSTVNAADDIIASAVIDGSAKENYTSALNLIKALEGAKETANVTLEKDLTINSDACSQICQNNQVNLKAAVAIDLNGNNINVQHTVSFNVGKDASLKITGDGEITTNQSNLVEVEGEGKLTIDGTIEISSSNQSPSHDTKALFAVKGNNSEVTIGKNVTVNTKGAGIVVYANSTTGLSQGEAKGVVINAAGTWTTEDYVIQVHGQVAKSSKTPATINIKEGTFTSSGSFALYASGYAQWNITGGEFTGKDAMVVRSGDVNISGTPTFTGTGTGNNSIDTSKDGVGAAIRISNDDRGPITPDLIDVNIAGGEFTTEKSDGYAIYITNKDDQSNQHLDLSKVKFAISDGTFTSDGDNAAIKIDFEDETYTAYDFIEDHEKSVTGGTFANGIVNDVEGPNGGSLDAAVVAKMLVGSDNFTEDEDGTIVVTNSSTSDPGTTEPGEEQKPGDNEPSENPKTFDAIGSLVAMAVSSLGVIGTATKKVLR